MVIHLGDETRAEVISSVLGQLSDGIWENSNAMHKYWMFADVEGTDLVISDDLNGGYDYYGKLVSNGFSGKSEKQIKDWFANKAKQVVKIWAEDEGKNPKLIWDRANDDDIVDYMGGHKVRTITVADVYECYDFLKGRSGKKYGIAANPLPYEVEGSTKRTFTKYPSNYVKADTGYTYSRDRFDKIVGLLLDYWEDHDHCTSEELYKYFEQNGIANVDADELNKAWEQACDISGAVDDEDTPVVLSNGIEIPDKQTAYTWLRENIEQYGNTYFWDGTLRRDLDKLIERFGSTYFWR